MKKNVRTWSKPDNTIKFKVGDVVRVNKSFACNDVVIGRIGTITYVSGGFVSIQLPEIGQIVEREANIELVGCDLRIGDSVKNLAKIQPEKIETKDNKIKVGDRIRCLFDPYFTGDEGYVLNLSNEAAFVKIIGEDHAIWLKLYNIELVESKKVETKDNKIKVGDRVRCLIDGDIDGGNYCTSVCIGFKGKILAITDRTAYIKFKELTWGIWLPFEDIELVESKKNKSKKNKSTHKTIKKQDTDILTKDLERSINIDLLD